MGRRGRRMRTLLSMIRVCGLIMNFDDCVNRRRMFMRLIGRLVRLSRVGRCPRLRSRILRMVR